MQRISADSARRFIKADANLKKQMLRDIAVQLKQDARKMKWQFLLKQGEKFTCAGTPKNYLIPITDDDLGEQIFVYGQAEFSKVLVALDRLRWSSVDTFIDVGANIGQVCIPGLQQGIFMQAIAIEPDPLNFGCLAINSHLGGVSPQIQLIHAAVGSGDSKTLEPAIAHSEFGDHQIALPSHLDQSRRVIEVPATTIDQVTTQLSPQRDLLWMDIQGYEAKALEGAEHARSLRIPFVMEFWPEGLSRNEVTIERIMSLLLHYSEFTDLSKSEAGFDCLSELPRLWEALLSGELGRGYVDILCR